MSFGPEEIFVGMIAYFIVDDLRADSGIAHTGGSPDGKTRPFVCYAKASDGRVYWTPLSTERTQSARKVIPPQYIRNALGRFVRECVVVNDGLHTYSGQAERFATHSQISDRKPVRGRTEFTPEGVAIVVQAVRERSGQLP